MSENTLVELEQAIQAVVTQNQSLKAKLTELTEQNESLQLELLEKEEQQTALSNRLQSMLASLQTVN